MLVEAAEYIAPSATMAAACMTAANLGPRVTGWGFVVFAAGSLAWSAIATASGQTNLLLTNSFLTVVNAVGIWRWLGRIARFDDGAKSAEIKSRRADGPSLVSIGAIEGSVIADCSGISIGKAVGLMAAAETGQIAYVVAGVGGVGGVGERLVALPWDVITFSATGIATDLGTAEIGQLDDVDPADWPDRKHLSFA